MVSVGAFEEFGELVGQLSSLSGAQLFHNVNRGV